MKKEKWVENLLKQLIAAGFDVGKHGVDGLLGKDTRKAIDTARSMGYVLLKDGRWIRSNNTPSPVAVPKSRNINQAVQNLQDKMFKSSPDNSNWQNTEINKIYVKAMKELPEVKYSLNVDHMKEYKDSKSLTNQISLKVNKLAQKGVDKAKNISEKVKNKTEEIYQSTDPIVKENISRYISNNIKNPYRANIDAGLYILDKAGVPSNVTNYLRDLNVSIPYRTKASLETLAKTLITGKGDYNETLENPSLFTTLTQIKPLINTNSNFTKEQLDLIKKAADDKGYITSSDIKRISSDGRYGKNGSISDYFSSDKIIQSALGQTTKDSKTGEMLDSYDFNTKSNVAKSDNDNYLQTFLENPNINYAALRAIAPYINTIDVVPDLYKIQTRIK